MGGIKVTLFTKQISFTLVTNILDILKLLIYIILENYKNINVTKGGILIKGQTNIFLKKDTFSLNLK